MVGSAKFKIAFLSFLVILVAGGLTFFSHLNFSRGDTGLWFWCSEVKLQALVEKIQANPGFYSLEVNSPAGVWRINGTAIKADFIKSDFSEYGWEQAEDGLSLFLESDYDLYCLKADLNPTQYRGLAERLLDLGLAGYELMCPGPEGELAPCRSPGEKPAGLILYTAVDPAAPADDTPSPFWYYAFQEPVPFKLKSCEATRLGPAWYGFCYQPYKIRN